MAYLREVAEASLGPGLEPSPLFLEVLCSACRGPALSPVLPHSRIHPPFFQSSGFLFILFIPIICHPSSRPQSPDLSGPQFLHL